MGAIVAPNIILTWARGFMPGPRALEDINIMPKGRPTKFDKKMKAAIELMARRGFTDEEMAECLQVTKRTFMNWKKAHKAFFHPLKDLKYTADKNVKRSLYERACGYACKETRTTWADGEWQTVEVIKHYPPDPTSMIFWLKNRQPEKWRDKQSVEHTGKDGEAIEVKSTDLMNFKGLQDAIERATKAK